MNKCLICCFVQSLIIELDCFAIKIKQELRQNQSKKMENIMAFNQNIYTTSIADNKDDIIDSIKKAKSKNKQLDELFLYINQELSESTTKSKKKPQYQLDIEKAAKTEVSKYSMASSKSY